MKDELKESEKKDTEQRSKIREIFKRHEYHNQYGNKKGYRIEDVMSNIEEYMHSPSFLKLLAPKIIEAGLVEIDLKQFNYQLNQSEINDPLLRGRILKRVIKSNPIKVKE